MHAEDCGMLERDVTNNNQMKEPQWAGCCTSIGFVQDLKPSYLDFLWRQRFSAFRHSLVLSWFLMVDRWKMVEEVRLAYRERVASYVVSTGGRALSVHISNSDNPVLYFPLYQEQMGMISPHGAAERDNTKLQWGARQLMPKSATESHHRAVTLLQKPLAVSP